MIMWMGDNDKNSTKFISERPWPWITGLLGDEKGGMKNTLYNMKVMIWKHIHHGNNVWKYVAWK